MKHASFFTGLGIVDLAAELLGWENMFQCEYDKWLLQRLSNRFPNTKQYANIKEFDGKPYRGTIDIISGGDPCQPSSVAGNRKGKADDRYLWPEMFRCIKEIGPGWVFNENVTGTISNGILDQKISDMESEGYTCWPPLAIPASAVGAPHERYRCFLIAYDLRTGRSERKGSGIDNEGREMAESGQEWDTIRSYIGTKDINVTNSNSERYEERRMPTEPIKSTFEFTGNDNDFMPNSNQFNGDISGLHSGERSQFEKTGIQPYSYDMCKQVIRDYEGRFQSSFAGFSWETNWHDVASEFCRMDDGTTKRLVDKGHRLKALGNGIVLPQILEFLCMINFIETNYGSRTTNDTENVR